MWKEQTDVAPWSGPASLAVCELSFELQSFIMIVAQNYYATMLDTRTKVKNFVSYMVIYSQFRSSLWFMLVTNIYSGQIQKITQGF